MSIMSDKIFICKFCNKGFKQKQGLQKHLDNSCKVKQEKEKQNDFDKKLNENLLEAIHLSEKRNVELKDNYERQIEALKNLNYNQVLEFEKVKQELEKQNQEIKLSCSQKILELTNQHEKEIINTVHKYELIISKLESDAEINKNLCDEFKNQIIKQTYSLEEIAKKAIENAGTKTTNTINNKNQIYNALEPLTDEYMQDQTQHLTYQNITNGAHGMAHFASNYTFKGRVMCSDKSRLNFVFKNENNVIIKDPEGVEITKKFIEINRKELLRLLDEYFVAIVKELDKDLDIIEYKHWSKRREEIIATRSAVKNGNVQNNQEYYKEFKDNFLSALSDLVPR